MFFTSIALAAAVSCTLDYPDRDIKRFFPKSTHYRVRDLLPFRHGSPDLMTKLEKTMGVPLDPEYETKVTPHTFYVVYEGDKYVGIVHGMNARAEAGPMQVFVAYEPKGSVHDVYIQKISSKDAMAFRSRYYRRQFKAYGTANVLEEPHAKPPVRSPSNDTLKDHHAVVRSVRLNILFVKYLYSPFKEK